MILAVEAGDGKTNHVAGEGETYEQAKAGAESLVKDGAKANAIRVLQDTAAGGHRAEK